MDPLILRLGLLHLLKIELVVKRIYYYFIIAGGILLF